MKHILYLAAGSSRRFGENKLLYPVDGIPLYLHGLRTLISVCAARTDTALTVVTRSEEIAAETRRLGASAILSPKSEMGISYTIRAGILALGTLKSEDYLLFAVADQPYLSADTVCALLDKADEGVLCATAAFGEQVGNPTLFSAALAEELCALEGDTGGRKILKRHAAECAAVQCRDAVEFRDVDVREDAESIRSE